MKRKIFAILGIIATITHFAYYLVHPYDTVYFFLGFGLLWLLFVAPLKYSKHTKLLK